MEKPWACARTGDCCRVIREVVMTHAERVEVERAAPSGVSLTFAAHPDARFTRLQTPQGCPLLDGNDCAIYASRPTNCRRWGCFRDDLSEPVSNVPVPLRVLASRENRRQFALMERKAMQWGMKHGWSNV